MEFNEIYKHKALLNEIPSSKEDANNLETWLKSKDVPRPIYEMVVNKIKTKSNTISTVKSYSVGYINELESRLKIIQLLALFGIIVLLLSAVIYKVKENKMQC